MTGREEPGRQTVEALLARTALRSEAALSLLRAAFCLAVLVRFVVIGAPVIDSSGLERSLVTFGGVAVALAFSAELLRRHAAGRAALGWLTASVVVDATICFAALLPNVLWPGSAYRGILVGPDIAAVLVVTIASGFRLSVPLAVLSGALNVLGTVALVVLDQTLGRGPIEYATSTAALWTILVAGAAGLAALSAWRTRSLALRGAAESIRSERMQQAVDALLQGHHDAHSLVSSLSLTAGLLERSVRDDPEATELAKHLEGDLEVLRSCIRQVRESAMGEVTIELTSVPVELGSALRELVARASGRLDGLSIELELPDEPLETFVAGGRAGLARVLTNLLTNARKGDGWRGASRVIVRAERDGKTATLVVEDDGPGLGEGAGPGVGLASVHGIARASGGSVEDGASALGGARFVVRLPAAGGAEHARGRAVAS